MLKERKGKKKKYGTTEKMVAENEWACVKLLQV